MPTTDQPGPLAQLVKSSNANLLVLDRESQQREEIVAQAAELHSKGVRIRTLSLFYDVWLGKLPISELERISLLFDINEIHRPAYARGKRALDLAVASGGILALALAVPIVAAVDLFGNRGPLFYSQPRVGKDGVVFTILKFRTMRPGGSTSTWTEADDPRLGKVGRMLRRLHVDELPQMWNVLRHDLSIVGPRPEQPHYVELLAKSIPFYELRHLVRPGITGWAQINYDYGSSDVDALEKLQYEFFYLRHQSLTLDLRIIGRTLRTVFEDKAR
jgi:lipopolysaccharide/colanic/teichoic acid biosynthesis glycosyltransferase